MAQPPEDEENATERTARISAGAMLLAAGRTRKAISGEVDVAIADAVTNVAPHPNASKAVLYAAIARSSQGMSERLRATILAQRIATRGTSIERLRVELGVAGVSVAAIALGDGAARYEDDLTHAAIASEGLTAQWRSMSVHRVMVARRLDTSVTQAIAGTREAMKPRIERTALTETSNAFNDEHRKALTDAAKQDPELDLRLRQGDVGRRWDSALERNTCEACYRHDGDVVGIDEEFSGGEEPGEMHVNCLCTETIVSR